MASSSGARFARQFLINDNQQLYRHPYQGQDFEAGMGAGVPLMPQSGINGGVRGQGVPTLPFASMGGIDKGGAYYHLAPQPSVADYAPIQQYAWTDLHRHQGNDTAFAFVDKSYTPPADGSYQANTTYTPKGEGMGGSFYLVIDNNQGHNIVPL